MKTTPKLIRYNISMTPEIHAKIAADADKQGLKISAYILKRCGVKPLTMGRPSKKAGK